MPAGSVLMLLPDMPAGVGSYDTILYDSGLFLRLYPVCRRESVLTILSCMTAGCSCDSTRHAGGSRFLRFYPV